MTEASKQDLTLGEMLMASSQWLEKRGVEEAQIKPEWVASHLLGVDRTSLPRHLRPGGEFADRLRSLVVRLGTGEPVQYVIGNWDFRFLRLNTDKRALIPRPETEQLVDLVLEERRLWLAGAPVICDVGTGTGAIALSIASERPRSRVIAVDCEEAALSLARENARLNCLEGRVDFRLGRNCHGAKPCSLDAVVSNPPYISTSGCEALSPSIRDFEPRSALDGGYDGLGVYRGLVPDAAIALKKGGFLFLEMGEEQGEALRRILEDSGFSDISVLRDLGGKDRFVKGRMV